MMYSKQRMKRRSNFKRRRRKFEIDFKPRSPLKLRTCILFKFLRAVVNWFSRHQCFVSKRQPENQLVLYVKNDLTTEINSTEPTQEVSINDGVLAKFTDIAPILNEITKNVHSENGFPVVRYDWKTLKGHHQTKSETSLPSTKRSITSAPRKSNGKKKKSKKSKLKLDHENAFHARQTASASAFLSTTFFILKEPPQYSIYPVHVYHSAKDQNETAVSPGSSTRRSSSPGHAEVLCERKYDKKKCRASSHNVRTSTKGLQLFNDTSTQFDELSSETSVCSQPRMKLRAAQYFEVKVDPGIGDLKADGEERVTSATKLDSDEERDSLKGRSVLLNSHGRMLGKPPIPLLISNMEHDAHFLFTNPKLNESSEESGLLVHKPHSKQNQNKCLQNNCSCPNSKVDSQNEGQPMCSDCCTSTTEMCVCSSMYPKFREWYEFFQYNMSASNQMYEFFSKTKPEDLLKPKINELVVPLSELMESPKHESVEELKVSKLQEEAEELPDLKQRRKQKSAEKRQHFSELQEVEENFGSDVREFEASDTKDTAIPVSEKASETDRRTQNIFEILKQRYPTFIGIPSEKSEAKPSREVIQTSRRGKSKDKKVKIEEEASDSKTTKMPKIIIKEKSDKKLKKADDSKAKAKKHNKQKPSRNDVDLQDDEPQDCKAKSKKTPNFDIISDIEQMVEDLLRNMPNSCREISVTEETRKVSKQEIKIQDEWSFENLRQSRVNAISAKLELQPVNLEVFTPPKQPRTIVKIMPAHTVMPLLQKRTTFKEAAQVKHLKAAKSVKEIKISKKALVHKSKLSSKPTNSIATIPINEAVETKNSGTEVNPKVTEMKVKSFELPSALKLSLSKMTRSRASTSKLNEGRNSTADTKRTATLTYIKKRETSGSCLHKETEIFIKTQDFDKDKVPSAIQMDECKSKVSVCSKSSQSSNKSSVQSFIKSLLVCLRYSDSDAQVSVHDISIQCNETKEEEPALEMSTSSDTIPQSKATDRTETCFSCYSSEAVFGHSTKMKCEETNTAIQELVERGVAGETEGKCEHTNTAIQEDVFPTTSKKSSQSVGVQVYISTRHVRDKKTSASSLSRRKRKKRIQYEAATQTSPDSRPSSRSETKRPTSRGSTSSNSFCELDILANSGGKHRRHERRHRSRDKKVIVKKSGLESTKSLKQIFGHKRAKNMEKGLKGNFLNLLMHLTCVSSLNLSNDESSNKGGDEAGNAKVRNSSLTYLMDVKTSFTSSKGSDSSPGVSKAAKESFSGDVEEDYAETIERKSSDGTNQEKVNPSSDEVNYKEESGSSDGTKCKEEGRSTAAVSNCKSSEGNPRNDKNFNEVLQILCPKCKSFNLHGALLGESDAVFATNVSKQSSFDRLLDTILANKRCKREFEGADGQGSCSEEQNSSRQTHSITELRSHVSPKILRKSASFESVSLSPNISSFENVVRSLITSSSETSDWSGLSNCAKIMESISTRRETSSIDTKIICRNEDFKSSTSSPDPSINSSQNLSGLIGESTEPEETLNLDCKIFSSEYKSVFHLEVGSTEFLNDSTNIVSGEISRPTDSMAAPDEEQPEEAEMKINESAMLVKISSEEYAYEHLSEDISITSEFIARLRFLWLKSGLRQHLSQISNLRILPIYEKHKLQRPSITYDEPKPVLVRIQAKPLDFEIIKRQRKRPRETAEKLPDATPSKVKTLAEIPEIKIQPIAQLVKVLDEKLADKYEIFAVLSVSSESEVGDLEPPLANIWYKSDEDAGEDLNKFLKSLRVVPHSIPKREYVKPFREPREKTPSMHDLEPALANVEKHSFILKIPPPVAPEGETRQTQTVPKKLEAVSKQLKSASKLLEPVPKKVGQDSAILVKPKVSSPNCHCNDLNITGEAPPGIDVNVEEFEMRYTNSKFILTIPLPREEREEKKITCSEQLKQRLLQIFSKRYIKQIERQIDLSVTELRDKKSSFTSTKYEEFASSKELAAKPSGTDNHLLCKTKLSRACGAFTDTCALKVKAKRDCQPQVNAYGDDVPSRKTSRSTFGPPGGEKTDEAPCKLKFPSFKEIADACSCKTKAKHGDRVERSADTKTSKGVLNVSSKGNTGGAEETKFSSCKQKAGMRLCKTKTNQEEPSLNRKTSKGILKVLSKSKIGGAQGAPSMGKIKASTFNECPDKLKILKRKRKPDAQVKPSHHRHHRMTSRSALNTTSNVTAGEEEQIPTSCKIKFPTCKEIISTCPEKLKSLRMKTRQEDQVKLSAYNDKIPERRMSKVSFQLPPESKVEEKEETPSSYKLKCPSFVVSTCPEKLKSLRLKPRQDEDVKPIAHGNEIPRRETSRTTLSTSSEALGRKKEEAPTSCKIKIPSCKEITGGCSDKLRLPKMKAKQVDQKKPCACDDGMSESTVSPSKIMKEKQAPCSTKIKLPTRKDILGKCPDKLKAKHDDQAIPSAFGGNESKRRTSRSSLNMPAELKVEENEEMPFSCKFKLPRYKELVDSCPEKIKTLRLNTEQDDKLKPSAFGDDMPQKISKAALSGKEEQMPNSCKIKFPSCKGITRTCPEKLKFFMAKLKQEDQLKPSAYRDKVPEKKTSRVSLHKSVEDGGEVEQKPQSCKIKLPSCMQIISTCPEKLKSLRLKPKQSEEFKPPVYDHDMSERRMSKVSFSLTYEGKIGEEEGVPTSLKAKIPSSKETINTCPEKLRSSKAKVDREDETENLREQITSTSFKIMTSCEEVCNICKETFESTKEESKDTDLRKLPSGQVLTRETSEDKSSSTSVSQTEEEPMEDSCRLKCPLLCAIPPKRSCADEDANAEDKLCILRKLWSSCDLKKTLSECRLKPKRISSNENTKGATATSSKDVVEFKSDSSEKSVTKTKPGTICSLKYCGLEHFVFEKFLKTKRRTAETFEEKSIGAVEEPPKSISNKKNGSSDTHKSLQISGSFENEAKKEKCRKQDCQLRIVCPCRGQDDPKVANRSAHYKPKIFEGLLRRNFQSQYKSGASMGRLVCTCRRENALLSNIRTKWSKILRKNCSVAYKTKILGGVPKRCFQCQFRPTVFSLGSEHRVDVSETSIHDDEGTNICLCKSAASKESCKEVAGRMVAACRSRVHFPCQRKSSVEEDEMAQIEATCKRIISACLKFPCQSDGICKKSISACAEAKLPWQSRSEHFLPPSRYVESVESIHDMQFDLLSRSKMSASRNLNLHQPSLAKSCSRSRESLVGNEPITVMSRTPSRAEKGIRTPENSKQSLIEEFVAKKPSTMIQNGKPSAQERICKLKFCGMQHSILDKLIDIRRRKPPKLYGPMETLEEVRENLEIGGRLRTTLKAEGLDHTLLDKLDGLQKIRSAKVSFHLMKEDSADRSGRGLSDQKSAIKEKLLASESGVRKEGAERAKRSREAKTEKSGQKQKNIGKIQTKHLCYCNASDDLSSKNGSKLFKESVKGATARRDFQSQYQAIVPFRSCCHCKRTLENSARDVVQKLKTDIKVIKEYLSESQQSSMSQLNKPESKRGKCRRRRQVIRSNTAIVRQAFQYPVTNPWQTFYAKSVENIEYNNDDCFCGVSLGTRRNSLVSFYDEESAASYAEEDFFSCAIKRFPSKETTYPGRESSSLSREKSASSCRKAPSSRENVSVGRESNSSRREKSALTWWENASSGREKCFSSREKASANKKTAYNYSIFKESPSYLLIPICQSDEQIVCLDNRRSLKMLYPIESQSEDVNLSRHLSYSNSSAQLRSNFSLDSMPSSHSLYKSRNINVLSNKRDQTCLSVDSTSVYDLDSIATLGSVASADVVSTSEKSFSDCPVKISVNSLVRLDLQLSPKRSSMKCSRNKTFGHQSEISEDLDLQLSPQCSSVDSSNVWEQLDVLSELCPDVLQNYYRCQLWKKLRCESKDSG